MARPAKQATCHPDRKHRAHGLCNNCYINSRNRTTEGQARRHQYYLNHHEKNKARNIAFYYKTRDRQIKLAVVRNRKRRKALLDKVKPKMRIVRESGRDAQVLFNKEQTVAELPRETPANTCDKDWWKLTDKERPRSWSWQNQF